MGRTDHMIRKGVVHFPGGHMDWTVAINLDGTLTEFTTWQGEGYIDPPKEGAVEAVERMLEWGWILWVHTFRKDHDAVEAYLAQHGFPAGLKVWREPGKPLAHAYLDNRAIRFWDWKQALYDLHNLGRPGEMIYTYRGDLDDEDPESWEDDGDADSQGGDAGLQGDDSDSGPGDEDTRPESAVGDGAERGGDGNPG